MPKIARAAKMNRAPVMAIGLISLATKTPSTKDSDTSNENNNIARCPKSKLMSFCFIYSR